MNFAGWKPQIASWSKLNPSDRSHLILVVLSAWTLLLNLSKRPWISSRYSLLLTMTLRLFFFSEKDPVASSQGVPALSLPDNTTPNIPTIFSLWSMIVLHSEELENDMFNASNGVTPWEQNTSCRSCSLMLGAKIAISASMVVRYVTDKIDPQS